MVTLVSNHRTLRSMVGEEREHAWYRIFLIKCLSPLPNHINVVYDI